MDRCETVLKLKCSVGNLKLKRRRQRHLMDRVKKPAPVMTAFKEETHENEHQSYNEVYFKKVQSEDKPNEDDGSTRSSSPVLSNRTLQESRRKAEKKILMQDIWQSKLRWHPMHYQKSAPHCKSLSVMPTQDCLLLLIHMTRVKAFTTMSWKCF